MNYQLMSPEKSTARAKRGWRFWTILAAVIVAVAGSGFNPIAVLYLIPINIVIFLIVVGIIRLILKGILRVVHWFRYEY